MYYNRNVDFDDFESFFRFRTPIHIVQIVGTSYIITKFIFSIFYLAKIFQYIFILRSIIR